MGTLPLTIKSFTQLSLLTTALLLISTALWQMEQPTKPIWGKYYEPHTDSKTLSLSQDISYKQSFHPANRTINSLLLQLNQENYENNTGSLQVTITQNNNQTTTATPLNQTSRNGSLLIPITPFTLNPDNQAEFTISLINSNSPIGLKFQRDSKKLINEQLTILESVVTKKRSGHLSFRLQYLVTPRNLTGLTLPIWLVLILAAPSAIAVLWYFQRKTYNKKTKLTLLSRNELLLLFFIALYSSLFIWLHLLPAKNLPVNADMTKDMLYLQTSANSIKEKTIPYWHHATCSGQPLLGNAETSTLSLGTPLALIFGSVVGLKLLISIEAAITALGVYFLSRHIGLKPLGATFPALLLPLSGFFVNRIFLGHTMYIGGLAFMPWILLTGCLSLKKPKWALVCSGLITLAFFRGDIRITFYTLIAFFVISVLTSLRKKHLQPILLYIAIIALTTGFSLVKALPVLEGAKHFHTNNLPELVAPLWRGEEIFNVFLDKSPNRGSIDVLNGEAEDWENIGLYIGILPMILAFLALFITPNKLRVPLVILIFLTLLIGEGTFYQETLRSLPMAGQLFRLPSRILIITVLAILILGGVTLDKIKKIIPHPIGLSIAVLLLISAAINISLYANQTLNRLTFVPPHTSSKKTTPRVINGNITKSELHPITINESGSVTPYSCQDFNRQPPYKLSDTKPFAMDKYNQPLLTSLSSNSITIRPNQDSETIQVHTFNSPLLRITGGFTSPTNEQKGPLIIIPQNNLITLEYFSTLALPGALFSTGFLLLALLPLCKTPHRTKV